MDACVRNALHDGALEIAAFANVLERRHSRNRSKGSSVILGVVSEIRSSMVVLRAKLLRQLREPIQLPVCLNVISCLRRLDALVLEKQPSSATAAAAAAAAAAHGGDNTGSAAASSSAPGTAPVSEVEYAHLQATLELKLQLDFLEAR